MPEFYVAEKRDQRIGDTWNSTGVFGLNIGGSLSLPESCPICGAPGQICIGDESHGTSTTPLAPVEEPPYADAA